MELYLHSPGPEEPELIERELSSTVADLLAEAGAEQSLSLWLQDADEPLQDALTLEEAGIASRAHVHRGRCRRIDVVVRYGGEDLPKDFSPSATIKRVFDWAVGEHGFKLSKEQRAKHVLAVPGADHFLAFTVHVGSVADLDTCSVVLDLAPRERFEG